MNHQPFRDWLLSEEQPSIEQSKALQDHLQTCDSCSQIESAWKELEPVILTSPQLEPAPGFTRRWLVTLDKYQSRQQSRRAWVTIGVTAVMVTSFLALLLGQLYSMLQTPESYLVVWLNRMVDVISIYYAIGNLSSFSGSIPVYGFIGLVLLVGIISFMSVLWLTAYRVFSMSRRSV
jgi:multidrug efflux pump subunit AcrB